MTEQFIQTLIYIHAFFGGLGLISGFLSIVFKKGAGIHRKAGIVFTISMLINSILSCFVAALPKHQSPFLFLIGVFTVYMVLAGNRALTFKTKLKANFIDKLLSWTMLSAAITMILISIVDYFQNTFEGINILFLVFGSIGTLMSVSDLRMHRYFREQKNSWLKNHLSKMTGAFIASLTAFLVVALDGNSLLIWLSPTILGLGYIYFWIYRVNTKTSGKKN